MKSITKDHDNSVDSWPKYFKLQYINMNDIFTTKFQTPLYVK